RVIRRAIVFHNASKSPAVRVPLTMKRREKTKTSKMTDRRDVFKTSGPEALRGGALLLTAMLTQASVDPAISIYGWEHAYGEYSRYHPSRRRYAAARKFRKVCS